MLSSAPSVCSVAARKVLLRVLRLLRGSPEEYSSVLSVRSVAARKLFLRVLRGLRVRCCCQVYHCMIQ